MARLQLNKSSLARETANLQTYKRFLPSLDLKRQQLMAERAKAAAAVKRIDAEVAAFHDAIGKDLPMLANLEIDLADLVQVTGVELAEENIVGTTLPTLERIDIAVRPYSFLAKPHWIDRLVNRLQAMLDLQVRAQIARRRLSLLDRAVDVITQRVNLFDKVLIPRTAANIKKIRIYLSDEEMAAVVRSKIAKRKRAELEPV